MWSPLGEDQTPGEVLVPLLLAAFVIVVAAFLVTVTLDMGQQEGGSEPATTTIEFEPDTDSVHVTYTSMARPNTQINVTVRDATSDEPIESVWLTSVGASYTFLDLEDGAAYEVVVVADWGDRQELVTIRSGRV